MRYEKTLEEQVSADLSTLGLHITNSASGLSLAPSRRDSTSVEVFFPAATEAAVQLHKLSPFLAPFKIKNFTEVKDGEDGSYELNDFPTGSLTNLKDAMAKHVSQNGKRAINSAQLPNFIADVKEVFAQELVSHGAAATNENIISLMMYRHAKNQLKLINYDKSGYPTQLFEYIDAGVSGKMLLLAFHSFFNKSLLQPTRKAKRYGTDYRKLPFRGPMISIEEAIGYADMPVDWVHSMIFPDPTLVSFR